jgi:hypothetical protein
MLHPFWNWFSCLPNHALELHNVATHCRNHPGVQVNMRHKWRGPQTKLHHGCPCRLLSTERGPLLEATIATHSTVAQQSQRSCPYGCQCRQPDAQKTFFQLGLHTNLPGGSSASTVQLIPRVGPLQTQEGHDTCQSPSD